MDVVKLMLGVWILLGVFGIMLFFLGDALLLDTVRMIGAYLILFEAVAVVIAAVFFGVKCVLVGVGVA